MATYHYYLRKGGKASEATAIHLHIHMGGKRLVYPTGCKVLPKHWIQDTEHVTSRVPTCAHCVAPPKGREEAGALVEAHRAINMRLEQLKAEAVHCVTEFARAHNRTPELHELRDALKRSDGAPVGDAPTDVFGYFEAFNERRRGVVHRNSTKPLHPTLHGRNRKALEYLKEYVASRNKGRVVPMHFSSLDADFISGFQAYLTKDKGFARNTVGKYLRAFREFLNDAAHNGKGIEVPAAVLRRGAVPIPEEETTQIYLSDKELDLLRGLDLSSQPRLDKARDLFIVGAWTGLRFGDLSKVRPEHVEGDRIRVPTAKTGKEVRIPLHPTVRAVLEKYGGHIPSGISNQKQNNYIKEVAAKVPELRVRVMAGRTQAGVHREAARSKWELITTHTARRSFATNLYKQGIPARTIMTITGHATERAFMRYIRLSVDEHMDLIAQSKLFQESTLRVA